MSADRIAGYFAGAILVGAAGLAIAFAVSIVVAIVHSRDLRQACIDKGGVPTRDYACLKPDAFMPISGAREGKDNA